MIKSVCKNCGHSFEGQYCNRCGQKLVGRFTASYLWRGLLQDVFGVEQGLVYTFKELLIRPGQMILNYIHGATARYYSPLKYLLLSAGAYVISLPMLANEGSVPFADGDLPEWISSIGVSGEFVKFLLWFMTKKSDLYFLGIIPFLSLATYIMYRSRKFNITEIVIFYTYFCAQFAFFVILMNLISLIPALRGSTVSSGIITIIYFSLLIMMQKGFFRSSWGFTFLGCISVYVLGTLSYWVVVFVGYNVFTNT